MKPRPVKSPLQVQTNDPLFLVKLGADLLKVHENLLKKVDQFNAGVSELETHAKRIMNLPAGERGPQGFKGDKGDPGKDGNNGTNGKDGEMPDLSVIAELVIAMLPKSKELKLPTKKEILEALKDELKENFTTKAEMRVFNSQLAGKVYGKDTWARGAGTTVSAGANITLTPLPDGTVQINASGGGSGTNVTTQYSLTAVQAGSDVTIDLSQLTNFATYAGLVQVQRNNIPQTETINFTQTPTEVTILEADAGEVFNIVYAYN